MTLFFVERWGFTPDDWACDAHLLSVGRSPDKAEALALARAYLAIEGSAYCRVIECPSPRIYRVGKTEGYDVKEETA